VPLPIEIGFALMIYSAGLLIREWWWLALAIFGGALLIRGWKRYVEPRSGLRTSGMAETLDAAKTAFRDSYDK
jgi:hypothetical protein